MKTQYLRNVVFSAIGKDPGAFQTVAHDRYSSLINILKGFEEYTLNAQGIIVSSNLEAVNITGYEEWEVIGKNFSMFYPLDDQLTGKPQDDLARAEKTSSTVFTSLWKKKRNASFWAKIKLKALYADETVVGYKMTLQDATHKAVTSHKLRRIKDEYLSLFNNPFVGILKFSMSDFNIFMMNDKAENLMGVKTRREKLLISDFFENVEDFAFLVKKLKVDKEVTDFEFKLQGTGTWLLLSLRYFQGDDFAEGIVVDITEVKRKDTELHRISNELDQFVYHASHELRAPLLSMLGIVNIINMEKECLRLPDYLSMIKDKIYRLDNLLTCIVAIPYNNNNSIKNEYIEFEKLVLACVKAPSFASSKVVIKYNIDQRFDFVSDLSRLKIIFHNLISNALKYFNPNLDQSNLWINIKVNEDCAEVEFLDNGIGIDPEHLKSIFKLFFKAHVHNLGAGLGLYIVKTMVDTLEGKVVVESDIESGTKFTLTIPNRFPKLKVATSS